MFMFSCTLLFNPKSKTHAPRFEKILYLSLNCSSPSHFCDMIERINYSGAQTAVHLSIVLRLVCWYPHPLEYINLMLVWCS